MRLKMGDVMGKEINERQRCYGMEGLMGAKVKRKEVNDRRGYVR